MPTEDNVIATIEVTLPMLRTMQFSLGERRFREAIAWLGPAVLDAVKTCRNCSQIHRADAEGFLDREGHWICTACDHYYSRCEMCEHMAHSHSISHIEGQAICHTCRDQHFIYCQECGDFLSRDHRCDSCCESPQMEFSITVDGQPVANDVEFTVGLPAGVIDSMGVERIRTVLRIGDQYEAANQVDKVGLEWQRRDGNFTKRLGRATYNLTQRAIPAHLLTEIGNIARQHTDGKDYTLAVTRDLNLSARDFGHPGSCWWISYWTSRCVLKTNGGFGLRSFADGEVTGRAWVMPVKSVRSVFVPTFDAQSPDGFIVFNCYGDLSGYSAARIVAQMSGMTYRKVRLSITDVYVNHDGDGESFGYLVAPEAIAAPYTDSSIGLTVDRHSTLHEDENAIQAANTEEITHVA